MSREAPHTRDGVPAGGADVRACMRATCDLEYLDRQARDALGRWRSWNSARRFLVEAEQRKANGLGLAASEEREAAARAYAAANDLREMTAATLRLVKHLRDTGVLGAHLAALKSAVRMSDGIAGSDLWESVVSVADARARIVRDLDETTLEEIGQFVEQADVTITLLGDDLAVARTQHEPIRLALSPEVADAGALWAADPLELGIDALSAGGVLGIEVFTAEDGVTPAVAPVFDPAKLLVIEAARAVNDADRYAELVSYHGVPAHRGSFWWIVIAIAAVAIIVGLVIELYCLGVDDKKENKVCEVGTYLWTLGLIALVTSGCLGGYADTCEISFNANRKSNQLVGLSTAIGPVV